MNLQPLFEPRGVIVVGASSHPAKFGFVALHNLLAAGYGGKVFAVNRDGGEILGLATATDVGQLPPAEADLAVVCTPPAANPDVLRACAAIGVKAAYVVSGGYRETGADGRRAEDELVALADKLDIVLAGPNGQGLVSTPAGLCAQIVGPYPPPGGISVVSQSGNTVSSFMNYAGQTGVGIARAVSAGNAAAVTVTDYLEWSRDDPATRTGAPRSTGCGRSPPSCRSFWSKVASPAPGSRRLRRTPERWRGNSASSPAPCARPVCACPTRWRRRSTPPPPSPHNRCPADPIRSW